VSSKKRWIGGDDTKKSASKTRVYGGRSRWVHLTKTEFGIREGRLQKAAEMTSLFETKRGAEGESSKRGGYENRDGITAQGKEGQLSHVKGRENSWGEKPHERVRSFLKKI